ncbi:MAG: hypothetical protein IPM92_03435 [Saprospiraceae bacterium]|nr:hypothetical protein [Saprospiraceae bacterium]
MKYILSLILLWFSYLLPSQASIIWQKTYGGNGSEFLRGGVLPTSYGYVIAGDSDSDLTGNKSIQNYGIWLIGIDTVGEIIWQKGYCAPSSLWSFKPTGDNNYIICASTGSDTCSEKSKKSEKSDVWIIKINEQGDIIWENTIRANDNESSAQLIQANDRGYFLGITTNSSLGLDKIDSSRGLADLWILKLHSLGKIQWQRTIGGAAQDGLTSISESHDGFLVSGYSHSAVSGDKTANKLWRI